MSSNASLIQKDNHKVALTFTIKHFWAENLLRHVVCFKNTETHLQFKLFRRDPVSQHRFHSVCSYRERACGLITFNSLIGGSANGISALHKGSCQSSASIFHHLQAFFFFCLELKPHAVEDHEENEICPSKALNHSSPAALYQNMSLFISNIDLATFHPLGKAAHNSKINRFFFWGGGVVGH